MEKAELSPGERLFVPNRKRLARSYITRDDGVRELKIDYGLKEIVFDDERFFPFGEQLVREVSFTGEMATAWGPGYGWDEVKPLLEALVGEGILKSGEPSNDPRGGGLVPSRLAPSQCPASRSWSLGECESITEDLAGRAVEIGNLEAVIAVFKIAHPALDADDRQVGEGNVFPARLRLDRETEWRVCQYAGSRYRDDAPMNITALRAMIKHWKPMMAVLLEVRAAMRARLGPRTGPWTIGELHAFAIAVLCLPAWQLMKRGGTSPQPALHPVMSSLFRITDGIRMTTYDMMFSIEHTRPVDEAMTAEVLYAHAEHHGLLIGATGVCAGPVPMIDEFLATAVDGAPADGIVGLALPDEVRAVLAELPQAIDYAMLGLQAWAVSLAVWLAMSRAYDAVRVYFDAALRPGDGHDALREELANDWRVLEFMQITKAYDREVHWRAYADSYDQAQRALAVPIGKPSLAEEIAPASLGDRAAGAALARLFAARFPHADPTALVEALDGYLREEQAILASATRLQAEINARLDRPAATRALTVRDFLVNYLMGSGPRSFPYVFDTFERTLGIRVACSADAIDGRGTPTGSAAEGRCGAIEVLDLRPA